MSELNEKEMEGRKLKVTEATPMEDRPKRDFNRGGGGRGNFGGNRGGNSGGNRSGGSQRRF